MRRILVTSAGNKIPLLKSIWRQGFQVYPCDSSERSAASELYDSFSVSPPDNALGSWLKLARNVGAEYILPTSDRELLLWSNTKELFRSAGVHVLVGDYGAVYTCNDKLEFGKRCPGAVSTRDNRDNSHTYSKPRWQDRRSGDVVWQRHLAGVEWSVDLCRVSGTCQAIARRRDSVYNGESTVTTIPYPRNTALEERCAAAAEALGVWGHVVFQAIGDEIIECNHRVGGCSTLAFNYGMESVLWMAEAVSLGSIPPVIGTKKMDATMTRFKADEVRYGQNIRVRLG